MKVTDYDYQLPESAIAIHPPTERGSTRLLRLNRQDGKIQDGLYRKLDDYLQAGDVLIINNTKVLPARLLAKTTENADRELLLLEKHGNQNDHHSSIVMYRRKIRPGQELLVGKTSIRVDEVFDNGTAQVSSDTDLWELAVEQGHIPLPPYMRREDDQQDKERYQTEFAEETGSVAAPTASLNLTNELLDRVKMHGIEVAEVTLHVGLGTFMPIRVDDVTKHKMHQEYFEIPADTVEVIRRAKRDGRRVIAVGTTVTRTLEYAKEYLLGDQIGPTHGEADIFIYPGYEFAIVDGMLTNFHAPHSTVLMMAAAFAGWQHLKPAYNHALQENYQFLSYGDSMLIL